jgi:hypothetical protein
MTVVCGGGDDTRWGFVIEERRRRGRCVMLAGHVLPVVYFHGYSMIVMMQEGLL